MVHFYLRCYDHNKQLFLLLLMLFYHKYSFISNSLFLVYSKNTCQPTNPPTRQKTSSHYPHVSNNHPRRTIWLCFNGCFNWSQKNGEQVLKLIFHSFLFLNCYTCLNGFSGKVFEWSPPTLEEYLPLDKDFPPAPNTIFPEEYDF